MWTRRRCDSAATSATGQKRRFRDVRDESAYPPIAALKRTWLHVAFVPIAAVNNRSKKPLIRSPHRRAA
jgi:hypothetical protein